MKKIPTLFNREFSGHRIVKVQPELSDESLAWVLSGDGVATEKFDGACCAIIDGKFYKRYDAKKDKKGIMKAPPEGAIPCDEPDPVTGHWPHWVLVDENDPGDKWFIDAYNRSKPFLTDGTYEAIGAHFNSNPYGFDKDILVRHGTFIIDLPDRSFDGIRSYLETHPIEGIVFWKDNMPQCKIKRSDFGFKWPAYETITVEMPEEEKNKLLKTLSELGLTIDGVTNAFLKWCVEYPDDALSWLRQYKEKQQ